MNTRVSTLIAGFFALTGGLAAACTKWGYQQIVASGNWTWSWPAGRYGSDFPEGGVIGVIYLLLILYLAATEPLRPPPVWRPLGTMIFALAAGIVFLIYGYGPGGMWMDYPGPWITILSTLAVLITAAIEMRGAFARVQSARAPNV